MPTSSPSSPSAPPAAERSARGDDLAYLLPMGLFLAFTWAGGKWPSFYPLSYVLKTLVVAVALIAGWKHYTKIRWDHWGLGALVGVLVVFQWVGMEKLLLHFWPGYPRMSHEAYVPAEHFKSVGLMWAFIAVRWAGASLLVPVMEELFWRDYLWRTFLAPNDFKLAKVGEWDPKTFLFVAIAFGAGVHVEWMTAIVCGLIYGALLVRTRSLGACIIAHGVTNFLLGAYVLMYKDWVFW
jgi:CAAX prenyl protease-like protein